MISAHANARLPNSVVAQETPQTGKPSQEEWRQKRQKHKESREQAWQTLNLTPEQTTQIDQIRTEGRETQRNKRQAFHTAREQMLKMMASEASDDQLRAQRQVVESLHKEMEEARFEHKLKIRKVLTPEQRQKWVELKQHRKGRGHRHSRRQRQFNPSDK